MTTNGRFTQAELETLSIDPRESAGIARCPWCGQDIIIGVRKDTGNITLAHAGHRDPTDPTGTRYISGCDAFMEALQHDDVIRRIYNAGGRFQKLVP
jgi:hypothetical protein